MAEYDKTGVYRELRKDIAERVKKIISDFSAREFSEDNYSVLGYGKPTSALGFMNYVLKGKAYNYSTPDGVNYKMTELEQDKMARLFRILRINQDDVLVTELSKIEPKFRKFYDKYIDIQEYPQEGRNKIYEEKRNLENEMLKDDRKFKKQIERFSSESKRQTKNYLDGLKKNYEDEKHQPGKRKNIIKELESYINFLESEGIFEEIGDIE